MKVESHLCGRSNMLLGIFCVVGVLPSTISGQAYADERVRECVLLF